MTGETEVMTAALQQTPLNDQQLQKLESLVRELDDPQLHWLQGYLAGYAAARQGDSQPEKPAPGPGPSLPLTLLYGSQTGNAETLAETLAERAKSRGLQVHCYDMDEYPVRQLKKEQRLAIITSTHGEGDPPDNAMELYEFLGSRKAPKLADTHYAVLALGDSSYEHFCQTGKDFDQKLQALGAQPLLARVDCDVDYDQPSEQWMQQLLDKLSESSGAASNETGTQASPSPAGQPASAPHYDRKHPYPAELLERICLNGRGSTKRVNHLEFSLEESGLSYEPGDSVGVMVHNDPRVVERLLDNLKLSGSETVELGQETMPLSQALQERLELTRLTRPTVERWAKVSDSRELAQRLENRRELIGWLHGRDLLDLTAQYPVEGLDAQTLVRQLRKLPPRLYSIASSQAAVEEEVHLTVAEVRYEARGREREGVASTWLSNRLAEDGRASVFIDRNKNFKLPSDPDTPIIMVGPGTGIAPFRAFMQEREAKGHKGKNWLFFGDRNFETDFLYQREWLQWRKLGLLNRLDVAFSRDGPEKVYVQHRIREAAPQVWAWLEEGAHFYVCGDANAMAPDVNEALMDVVMQEGKKGREQAQSYLRELTKAKRYQRDVY